MARLSEVFFGSSFDQGSNFVRIFKESFPAVADNAMGEIAIWMSQEVKKRIRDQRFAHVPLTKPYLQYKKRVGLDSRILIATGDYVNSIVARRRLINGELCWTVGVPDTIHQGSGLTYTQLARIHEFGSARAHIPARPHWRPVWAIAKAIKFPGIIEKITADLIKETTRSTGGKNKTPTTFRGVNVEPPDHNKR